nr:MAG TPA: hypothetical protein [Caudoviricetes sp.]
MQSGFKILIVKLRGCKPRKTEEIFGDRNIYNKEINVNLEG